jgi:hypothetical protein
MFAWLFSWAYMVLLFALAIEADSSHLKVIAVIAGIWMGLAGTIALFQATRR